MTARRLATRNSGARNRELALIHIAAQQMALDDSTYRDMLWSVARVRSAGQLDQGGRNAVLRHLKGCGWQGAAGKSRYRKGSQAALIRHLWTVLARAGLVVDGSDRALRAFTLAQSAAHDPAGHGWDDPIMLPRGAASAVIEHLKQWCRREGIAT